MCGQSLVHEQENGNIEVQNWVSSAIMTVMSARNVQSGEELLLFDRSAG